MTMSEKWRGTFTALVTPFRTDESIDAETLGDLVDHQVEGKVEGILACGTTGEAPTLTNEEHLRVIELVVERAARRVPVMAGVGGNNTANVLALATESERLGAEAVLITCPYYNKPTQEGMYRHFATVADAIEIPVFVYNVPGRTSSNLQPATTLRLARHDNVRGVKEASGSLPQVMEILAGRPESFRGLSGDDALALPMLALGGDGVVSVVSNEAPLLMSNMVREGLSGDVNAARQLHDRLLGLMNANFLETNPIPVKAALAIMGRIEEIYRLPLVPLSDEHRGPLEEELRRLELIP